MIQKQIATVWYAPTRGRRYFSKTAAISAEATALILKKYPLEPYEEDTGYSYDIRVDDPDHFNKLHNRLCRILKNG